VPHAIWKGAINFGLVYIPVALYPAASEIGIDFDWLDKRSMDPVGYKRVNKKTGREIDKADIVKGVKVDGGRYVVLSEDEIRAAYPKTTQSIQIESFADAAEIPFVMLERPYYLEPVGKGEKVYALLREAMAQAGVVGIARVVMHTKEYLAALIPAGPGLVLNTLRWAEEIRPWTELKLPAAGKAGLKASELTMATQLIESMKKKWTPDAYADKFTSAVHALVSKRVRSGATEEVTAMEEPAPRDASNVVDLTALLKQSLGKPGRAAKPKPAHRQAAAKSRTGARPARKRA